MEDILKVLQQSDSLYSSDDSDVSICLGRSKSTENNLTAASKVESDTNARTKSRLPTRRPDPNVYNRNALLARENRRKKKAHLATVEKELEEARKANKSLLKALKKQLKVAQQLEQEKRYFRSILNNRREILSLVAALNSRLPLSPSSIGITLNQTCDLSEGSISSYDPAEQSQCFTFEQTSEDNDFESASTSLNELNWSESLDDEFDLMRSPSLMIPSGEEYFQYNNINDEHSYVISRDNSSDSELVDPAIDDAGYCLHIANDLESLEFCPSCHWHVNRTPPTQLLQEDAPSVA